MYVLVWKSGHGLLAGRHRHAARIRAWAAAARPPFGRGEWLATGAAAAWVLFYGLWYAVEPGGARALLWFADTAYLVPLATASLLAALALLRAPAALRPFWALTSLACGSWFGGELLWSVRELDTGTVPFPWWTDLFYVAFYVLLGAALWSAFRPRLGGVGAARLVDAALAVGALALLWWWIVLRPLPVAVDLESLAALSPPTLALILLGFLVATRLLPVRHGTLGTRIVGAGLVVGAVADGVYTHGAVTHSYVSGQWLELAWQAEALLYSLAGLTALRLPDVQPDWTRFRRPSARGSTFLAVGGLGVAAVVASIAAARNDTSGGLVAAAAALGLLALTRLLHLQGALRPRPDHAHGPSGRYGPLEFEDGVRWLLERSRFFGGSGALLLIVFADVRDPRVEIDYLHARLGTAATDQRLLVPLQPGRYALLVANVNTAEATVLAESLVGATAVPISVGGALTRGEDVLESLVQRAQHALDRALRAGPNQIRIAGARLRRS